MTSRSTIEAAIQATRDDPSIAIAVDAPRRLEPGETFYFTRSGIIYTDGSREGAVSRHGQTVVVTRRMLDASIDRSGRSFLDLINDEDAQVARWGRVVMRPGPAPEGMRSYEPGTAEADEARAIARDRAWAILDDEQRADALAAVQREFGGLR